MTLAKEAGVPIRALVMDVDKPMAMHLNAFRSLGYGDDRRRVPMVAINSYFSKFEKTLSSEGFSAVVHVPFVCKPFHSAEEERDFFSYLCD